MAEDPQEGTQLQMPHLKGQAIEEVLNTVYRRYCGASGFMSIEQFIEFFEDSAILHVSKVNGTFQRVSNFMQYILRVKLDSRTTQRQ